MVKRSENIKEFFACDCKTSNVLPPLQFLLLLIIADLSKRFKIKNSRV